jgi:hypothetical protein
LESNWRFNVAVAGMVGSDWRLAARVLGAPFLAIANPDAAQPGSFRVYTGDLSTSLPTFVAYVEIPPGSPHFPYGVNVEPD